MSDLESINLKEKKNRVRWGFIWAIACAIFWGLGYVPLSYFWEIDPIATLGMGDTGDYIVASLINSAGQAIFFAVILTVIWAGVTGKLGEYKKVITNKNLVKYLFVGALFGGPLAIFGSALTIGYIGGGFAASIALLCSVTAALFGRLMNKEKMSKKTIVGILILVVGGIVILNPQNMIDDITNSSGDVWLGYLGAVMSVFGWGIEGNISVKALDVSDADVSNPVRFTVEALFWLIILIPLSIIIGGANFTDNFVSAFTNSDYILWMIMAGFSLGFCYVTEYKAFPLIGVGRTLSIASFYVPVSLVGLWFFLGQEISIYLLVGMIIAVIGVFVMYWESDSLLDSTRDVGGE